MVSEPWSEWKFLSGQVHSWQALRDGAIDETCLDAVGGGDGDILAGDLVGDVRGGPRVGGIDADVDEGGVAGLAERDEVTELSDSVGDWCVGWDAGVFSESGEAAQISKHLGEDAIGADAFELGLDNVRI